MNRYRFYNFPCFFLMCMTISSKLIGQNVINKIFGDKNENAGGFEIIGNLKGLRDGEKVILFENSDRDKQPIPSDSAIVKDGTFYIKGGVPDIGPRSYVLGFDQHQLLYYDFLISNNEKITLTCKDIGDVDSFSRRHRCLNNALTITGSPSTKTFQLLFSAFRMYQQSISRLNTLMNTVQDSIGFNGPFIEGIVTAKKNINTSFYKSYLSNLDDPDLQNRLAIPVLVYSGAIFDVSERSSFLMEFYNSFTEKEKETLGLKKIKEYADLSVGQPFPLFSLSTIDGKKIALKQIISKSKVTLVNFWGSTLYKDNQSLALTKRYHDELRMMYKRYHDKGLNIIGVAAEDSSTLYNYQKILREQQFPWSNVSDLKGHDRGSIINDIYKEGGHRLPNITNVLIDDKGNVIAWDPSGIMLQYYLWKAFGE